MKYGFGVDLGGTTVKIAYFDENGAMLCKWEIPTDISSNGKNILSDISASIHSFLQEKHIDRSSIIGIGIGVPGAVLTTGEVNCCENLGWGRFNVTKEFSDLVGFPVKATNDANAAALGEYWKGSGEGTHSMVMVTLGTGLGGGIVINGNLIGGAHGSGGEIAHIVLNHDEKVQCNCGKYGCAEQYCSATGIVRLTKKALLASSLASPLRQIDNLTCKDVFDCGKAGDPLATEILQTFYRYLGEFIANLSMILDPEVVVFGGGVSKAGTVILDGIRPYFEQSVFHASRDVKFTLAQLGNDAGAYGAFKLVLDQIHN